MSWIARTWRDVTFLSTEAWEQACEALGVTLAWHIRRANLLIDGLDVGTLLGKTVRLGEVVVRISGESKPCDLMDRQQAGLRGALKPSKRGGVFGEVIEGGKIRVGERITIL